MSDVVRTQHVLIVEDEPRLRDGLQRAVPAMGFVPVAAGSAEEALTLMERDPCEVVLLDLRLPGMSGMTFFETIKKRWPRTQVIIVTGYGDLASAQKAIHLEAVEFMTKPCTLSELETAIGRACQRYVQASATGRKPALAIADEPAPAKLTAAAPAAQSLDDVEREHILAALERHRGNRTAAAQELGISRRTLHYRLREYADRGMLPRDI